MPVSHTPRLQDIPETMLWTLHNRASEAQRSDAVLHDPKAIEIYQVIDYDFERNFGSAEPSHALRSLAFDQEITTFLQENPDGIIVNLGEGLETQRHRIQAPRQLWLSVDLPDSIEIRERFMPPDDQHIHHAISALDRAWLAAIPADQPVFISAQGLFMYFSEKEVQELIQDIFTRFKRGRLMFDTIPVWLSKKTTSAKGWGKTKHYATPPMPWGIPRSKLPSTMHGWLGEEVSVEEIGYPAFPRGAGKWLYRLLYHTPGFKDLAPTIVKISRHGSAV